jgi:hypothetical protein
MWEYRLTGKKYREVFWGDSNVPCLDRSLSCTSYSFVKIHGKYYICISLYINFTFKKELSINIELLINDTYIIIYIYRSKVYLDL